MKISHFRILIFTAFAVLAGSIIWPFCGNCARAAATVAGIPLDYLGLGFYLALGLAALTPLRGVSLYAIFLGLGFQGFMLSVMFHDHHFCTVCLVVAALCFAAASVAQRLTRQWVLPAFAILVGVTVARFFVTSIPASELSTQPALEKMLVQERHQPASRGDLLVYVFSREGCCVCQEFWSTIAPRLQADFGAHLQFKKIDPQDHDLPTPTFVVYSSYASPKMIGGLPPQDDLEAYLHAQTYWRAGPR